MAAQLREASQAYPQGDIVAYLSDQEPLIRVSYPRRRCTSMVVEHTALQTRVPSCRTHCCNQLVHKIRLPSQFGPSRTLPQCEYRAQPILPVRSKSDGGVYAERLVARLVGPEQAKDVDDIMVVVHQVGRNCIAYIDKSE